MTPDSVAVARYLIDNPQFFEEHTELIATLKLTSPVGGRTISLQERQMEVLREKIKGLELRMAEWIRLGQENDAIAEKYQEWTRSLLLARNDADLPRVLTDGLQSIFAVPHATLRVWDLNEQFAQAWFVADVSSDARLFANGLHTPYCGPNNDFEAASWLDDAASIRSVAILPLRTEAGADAYGLVVLGSPDTQRFTSDMGTDFLRQVSDTASAALNCLRV